MDICILNAAYLHGGAGVIVHDLAKGMSKKGHRVTVICSDKKSKYFFDDGAEFRFISNPKPISIYQYINPVLIGRLMSELQGLKPDLLHIHNVNLKSFSLLTFLLSNKYATVWTAHDLWILCMTGWPDPPDCGNIYTHCLSCPSWSNAVVRLNKKLKELTLISAKINISAPCQWMIDILKQRMPFLEITKVVNGIDKDIFNPLTGAVYERLGRLKSHTKKKVILFCGGKRLGGSLPAERKGWDYLVRAMRNLSQGKETLKLLYVGDRIELPQGFEIETCFVEGVTRNEMPRYYNMADIFILPTLADNSPLTLLEAMACKVPVITTAIGGIPEAVEDKVSGLLCPPRDPAALAVAIAFMLENPAKAISMADSAYERFLAEFTFDKMIDGYEDLYARTIESFNSARG